MIGNCLKDDSDWISENSLLLTENHLHHIRLMYYLSAASIHKT